MGTLGTRFIELADCENCPLNEVRDPVPGSGAESPVLVLIGQGPGAQEKKHGRPFVGPSGSLLDQTLQEAGGIDRRDVYITNTVLCKPGEGHDVPPEAMTACRPRLQAELNAVIDTGTRIGMTLGAVAGESLWPGEKFGDYHGSVRYHRDLDLHMIPTFHPAAVLYGNVSAFEYIYDAIEMAGIYTKDPSRLPDPDFNVEYLHATDRENTKVGLQHIEDLPGLWAIDVEADAVNVRTDALLQIGVSNGERQIVFEHDVLSAHADLKQRFKRLLRSRYHTWILHNAKFDFQFLHREFNTIPKLFEDTMALALCLTERSEQIGLKYLARKWMGADYYEHELRKYVPNMNTPFSKAPRPIIAKYNAYDTYYTYWLYPLLLERVRQEGNLHLYEDLLKPAQRCFAQLEFHGTLIDLSYVKELKEKWEPILEGQRNAIADYAESKGFKASDVIQTTEDRLNPNSRPQLAHLIYDIRKFPPLGDNGRTTGALFREKYPNDELVLFLENYETARAMMSNYVNGISKHVSPTTGRAHPDFRIDGTVTGRLSIREPALQTIPRKDTLQGKDAAKFDSIKTLFNAPPGHVFCEVDYRQLELRVAWMLSEDENIGAALSEGDFHRAVAAKVYATPYEQVTDKQREYSKFVTFGLMYGREAYSIAEEHGWPQQQAQEHIDSFFREFPKYGRWWIEHRSAVEDTGRLTTPFGRVRRWRLILPQMIKHMRNQAVNFPIQSTASDLCLSAMIKLTDMLPERDLGHCLFTVHDSITFELREDRLDESLPLIDKIMSEPPFGTSATFPVEISVGANWGVVEEWTP